MRSCIYYRPAHHIQLASCYHEVATLQLVVTLRGLSHFRMMMAQMVGIFPSMSLAMATLSQARRDTGERTMIPFISVDLPATFHTSGTKVLKAPKRGSERNKPLTVGHTLRQTGLHPRNL
jgi:hypothetical protein